MCGIAGIVNKVPRAFDYSTFCTLGIANDARGGDSCGVFIDGKYEYGTKENKLFANYFLGSDLLYEADRASIALLHCRKASVGSISEKTAQPVIIKNAYGNVDYVLMHNGTIYNYEALAKKYIPDIDITGMTDSQVMAHIFYHTGYESLNEYNGGAVFAIVDYRELRPKVMLFKGASKKTKWDTKITEERPLFYCIDKAKRELVFSSIGIHLVALRKKCDTYCLRENTLCEFTGTELTVIKYYSRESAFQQKEYAVQTSYRSYSDVYSLYDDDKGESLPFVTVDLNTNRYLHEGTPLHGKVYLSIFGKIQSSATKDSKRTVEVFFFDGVALKHASCFRFLVSLRKESKLSDKDFFNKFNNVIRFLSIDRIFKRDSWWYRSISPTGCTLFTGTYRPLFSCSVINIVGGQKVATSYSGKHDLVKELLSEKLDINFKKIKEECKCLMK